MTFEPIRIPVLETPRLLLRGIGAGDIDGFCEIYADGEHSRFVGGPKSRHQCWEKLLALAGHWQIFGWGRYAVVEKATGTFLGHCGPTFVGEPIDPEINYSFAPRAAGKGFATEAVACVLTHVYRDRGWSSAWSLIDPENNRSKAVARRLGAQFVELETAENGLVLECWKYPDAADFLAIQSGAHAELEIAQ